MRRILLVLFLAAPLAAQDGEIEDLVRRLGAEDFSARSEAFERLAEIGEPARPAIERAATSGDAEVRLRAARLLEIFARRVPVGDLLAAARARQLRLVTLDLRGAPPEQVVAALDERTGADIILLLEGAGETVDVSGREAPIQEVLNPVGWDVAGPADQRTRFTTEDGRIRCVASGSRLELRRRAAGAPPPVAVPGAAFAFSRRAWAPSGAVEGWVLEIDARRNVAGEIEWWVAEVVDGAGGAVAFETCRSHSPDRIYVPRADLEAVEVRIEGVSRWLLDVPVEIDRPTDRVEREIGGWVVRVAWPTLAVRPPRPVHPTLYRTALRGSDVRCELTPDGARMARAFPASEDAVGAGGAFGGRIGPGGAPSPAWCGCTAPAAKHTMQQVPAQMEQRIEIEDRIARLPIEAIAKIAFTFHLPVDEPFELRSGPIPVR